MSYSYYMDGSKVAMSTDPDNTILPDIIMSLSIPVGSWFLKPTFGHELKSIRNMTADAPALVEAAVNKALAWLLTTGRASSINVSVEKDESDSHRINYLVEARQADGYVVTWGSFWSVI